MKQTRMTAAQYRAAPAKRRHKYGAKRTVVDGLKFDSKGEAFRWLTLKHQERAGLIEALTRQPKIALYVKTQTVGSYIGDFSYYVRGTPTVGRHRVIEDWKGYDTPFAKWKRKHCELQSGIKILLTGPAKRRRSA